MPEGGGAVSGNPQKGQVWQRGAKGRHIRITDVYSEWADFVGVDDGKKGSARRDAFGRAGPHGYRLVMDAPRPAPVDPPPSTPPTREWHGCTDPRGHSFSEGKCDDCGMDLAKGSTADPAPSPLARVSESLVAVEGISPSLAVRAHVKEALAALAPLELALPDLMQAWHSAQHVAGRGMYDMTVKARWQDCDDCRAKLEGR